MGRMEGPAHVMYPCYVFHGKFERNLPIGPGVFSFDLKILLHGYYINMKDPKFDYIGTEDDPELKDIEENQEPVKGAPRGIVPIWRSRHTTDYNPALMPPEPIAVPYCPSELSLLDIIEYLERQYGSQAYLGEHEEEDQDDVYKYKRLVDMYVPPQLDPAEPRDIPPEPEERKQSQEVREPLPPPTESPH